MFCAHRYNTIFEDVTREAPRKLAFAAVVLPHGETITKALDSSRFEGEPTTKALELQAVTGI